MSAKLGKLVIDNDIEVSVITLTYGMHSDGTLMLTAIVEDNPTDTMLALKPYTIGGNGVMPHVNSLVAYDEEDNVIFSDTTHNFTFSSAKVDLFTQSDDPFFASKLSISFVVTD